MESAGGAGESTTRSQFMAKFAIFMRENDNAWMKFSPEEQQQLLGKYYAWVDELKSKGAFLGGQPLRNGGRLLHATGGEIVDGPFTETKEVLTGFFLIEASDLGAATAIARGCPALGHGETVELREIGHD
jgi:hypothetical protein